MSESLLHQKLVTALIEDVKACASALPPFIYADGHGSALPQLIGNVRPDVYAHFTLQKKVIVGEAKTSADVESMRTLLQLEQYFEHLGQSPLGELWMAVPWTSAGAAVRVCSVIKRRMSSPVAFRVSGWMFGDPSLSRVWYG